MARVGERTRRRVRPGVLFPVAVFVVWRLAQLAVTRAAGGDGVDTAFQYDGNAYRRIFEHGYLAAWLQTARPWLRWVVYGALAVACVLMTRYWARGTFIG